MLLAPSHAVGLPVFGVRSAAMRPVRLCGAEVAAAGKCVGVLCVRRDGVGESATSLAAGRNGEGW